MYPRSILSGLVRAILEKFCGQKKQWYRRLFKDNGAICNRSGIDPN